MTRPFPLTCCIARVLCAVCGAHDRRLYERAVQQRWSSKKMKFFLKRFLDFERRHGDAATMEHVKELARAYVAAA